MSPDRQPRKNQAPKAPKPTRYRPRHLSLRDLREETTTHGFVGRIHTEASPTTNPSYSVIGKGESHTINLTNENFPGVFSCGEKRQVTAGSRSRKTSPSASSCNSSSPSRPSSVASSRSSPAYSPTSNLSLSPSSPSWPLSSNTTEFQGNAYVAPQDIPIPVVNVNSAQGIVSGDRFMAPRPAMQRRDTSLSLYSYPGHTNNYAEGKVDASVAAVWKNSQTVYSDEFVHPLVHNETPSEVINSPYDPGHALLQLHDQQLCEQPYAMNVQVVEASSAPHSFPVASGGQPYGYSSYQQNNENTANNHMYAIQQNSNVYAQGYQDPSILTCDPNTPRIPDYYHRN